MTQWTRIGHVVALVIFSVSPVAAQNITTVPVSDLETGIGFDISGFEGSILDTVTLLPVQADEGNRNRTYAAQDGLDNILLIDQSGNDNTVGTSALAAQQDGDRNLMFIRQTGNDNAIGDTALRQAGEASLLRVDQDGAGNVIENVVQQNEFAGDGANAAVLIQSNRDATDATVIGVPARIGRVLQRKTLGGDSNLLTVLQRSAAEAGVGPATIAGLVQTGAGNIAAIEQSGPLVASPNSVVILDQLGIGNVAGLRQEGVGNLVIVVEQAGTNNRLISAQIGVDNMLESVLQNNALSGDSNLAVLSIAGNGNGATSGRVRGAYRVGSAAEGAGVEQAALLQIGGGSSIDIAIGGDDNLYGVSQVDDLLFASMTIDGNANEGGIRQTGTGSRAVLDFTGNENDGGIIQLDDGPGIADAIAEARINGSRNSVALFQQGPLNRIIATVSGDDNTITMDQIGDGNGAVMAPLFGVALMVAPDAGTGTISQTGDRNDLAVQFLGDLNAFAFAQNGEDNRLRCTILGNGNAASVVQIGRANIASFAQRGGANSIGLRQ